MMLGTIGSKAMLTVGLSVEMLAATTT
jgi:hypothetical protein